MSRRSVSKAKPHIAFPLDHSVDDQSYESSGKFADRATAKTKIAGNAACDRCAVTPESVDGDFHRGIACPTVPRDGARIVIQVNLKSPFASASKRVRIVT